MSSKPMLSQEIKALAAEAGFDACGISAAGPVDEGHAAFFRKWLEDGRNADMHYMAGYEDKRLNPALLAAGAKSVISLALNYHQERRIDKRQWQIATYAYGKDYHTVVKSMLHALALKLRDVLGINVLGVYCDTAPVLERYWAWRGGLGWIGRNTQLIIPGKGSNFFLGEILVDVETDYDSPMDSRCGDCMRCVNACPGKALCAAGGLDAGRCLSYLTIEYRGDMSGEQGFDCAVPALEFCDGFPPEFPAGSIENVQFSVIRTFRRRSGGDRPIFRSLRIGEGGGSADPAG